MAKGVLCKAHGRNTGAKSWVQRKWKLSRLPAEDRPTGCMFLRPVTFQVGRKLQWRVSEQREWHPQESTSLPNVAKKAHTVKTQRATSWMGPARPLSPCLWMVPRAFSESDWAARLLTLVRVYAFLWVQAAEVRLRNGQTWGGWSTWAIPWPPTEKIGHS